MNLTLPPLKPGVKTSEFWMVVICGLLLTVQEAFSLVDTTWAAGGVTILGLLYASLRGRLKGIHAQAALEQLKAQSDASKAAQ